mgnify:CR=1 FL=1
MAVRDALPMQAEDWRYSADSAHSTSRPSQHFPPREQNRTPKPTVWNSNRRKRRQERGPRITGPPESCGSGNQASTTRRGGHPETSHASRINTQNPRHGTETTHAGGTGKNQEPQNRWNHANSGTRAAGRAGAGRRRIGHTCGIGHDHARCGTVTKERGHESEINKSPAAGIMRCYGGWSQSVPRFAPVPGRLLFHTVRIGRRSARHGAEQHAPAPRTAPSTGLPPRPSPRGCPGTGR